MWLFFRPEKSHLGDLAFTPKNPPFPKALGLIAGGSFGAAVGLIPAIFTFGALGSTILLRC